MRLRITIGVVAAAGVVALSGASVSAAPATSGATPRRIAYPIEAELGIGLTVKWSFDEGDRNGPCVGQWRHYEGTNEVNGGSVGKMRGGLEINPPARFIVDQKLNIWALGRGRGVAERRLTVTGGTKTVPPGGTNCNEEAYVPPPNDCGTKAYSTKVAQFRPEYRKLPLIGRFRLEDWLTPRLQGNPVLSITLQPMGPLFRACEVRGLEFPTSIGLPLLPRDIRKLRALKAGERYRVAMGEDDGWKGKCAHNEPATGITCTFTLEAHIDIRRVS